jgi:predicted transglutaminase-like cysteine proteinase
MAPAMISLLKKTLWVLIVAGGSTSAGLAQSNFFEVRSTPYDHQMQRVQPILTESSAYRTYSPSLNAVNAWMSQLREMPYRYSHEWRTPSEVAAARVGDCKGKAVLLYDWMEANGATNVRLVIGKRRAEDGLTHAWLEWQTRVGTLLLDPTFNWNASIKLSNPRTYVAFYGYEGRHKYQASDLLLAKRTMASRTPAAPAHGVIPATKTRSSVGISTRSNRTISRVGLSARSFNEAPVDPRFCWRGL